jgi:uncharacterized repeat protein (TIGR01451 family)
MNDNTGTQDNLSSGGFGGGVDGSEAVNIVFVDPNIPDFQTVIAGLDPAAEVFILDPELDGVQQITEELSWHENVASVQVISHGSSGSLQLGATQLDSGNIGSYAADLHSWADSLSADADIMLLGCDVASGAIGRAFVEEIALHTGADVAASIDPTGSAALGGDWDLEVTTGAIEASSALSASAQESFDGLLLFGEATANTEAELIALIQAANLDAAPDTINLVAGTTYTLTAPTLESTTALVSTAFNQPVGATGLPFITSPITINGNGATLTRDAMAEAFRFFYIPRGSNIGVPATSTFDSRLILNDLTITNGLTESPGANDGIRTDGGVLYNIGGTVIINNSTLDSNFAFGVGGAIQNTDFLDPDPNVGRVFGTMVISNSTISNNTAFGDGAGVVFPIDGGGGINTGATGNNGNPGLTIINSTISGNTAGGDANTNARGGGILQSGPGELVIANTTVAFNTVSGAGLSGDGGGIYRNTRADNGNRFDSGDIFAGNNIIAGNTATAGTSPDVFGDFGDITPAGINLVGDDTGATFATAPLTFATEGIASINEVLDPTLALNGAPAGSPLTHALREPGDGLAPAIASNSAIDSGTNGTYDQVVSDLQTFYTNIGLDAATIADLIGTIVDTDERGAARVSNGTIDLGAYEVQGNVDLTVDKAPAPGSPLQVLPGSVVTYTIEVVNNGSADADNVSIEDIFPTELLGVSWTIVDSEGTVFTGTGDITQDGVVVEAGETAIVTVTGIVDCDLGVSATLSNTATATPIGMMDDNPADNTDTDTSFFTPLGSSPGVFGGPNALFIAGTPGNDLIFGGDPNQTINGNLGNDTIFGGKGRDRVNGGLGDDLLIGGDGNDELLGGQGNDTLDGACTSQGVGQIDRLTGSGGAGDDVFVLGNQLGVYYLGNGNNDFAYITDFDPTNDQLVLVGSPMDYTTSNITLNITGINITGQGIFFGGDLIAILQYSAANLNSDDVIYI